TEKIQGSQGGNGPGQDKGHEGQGGDHGIGQHVSEHDQPIGSAQGSGCTNIFKVAGPKKFSPDHIYQSHQAKEQHNPQQPPEVGLHETRQNDQQIQHGQSGPNLDKALAQQVNFAAVEALQGADNHAHNTAGDGEYQAEQNGDTKTVD